jgi:NADH-quinone oxidoreductase subunit F
MGYTGPLADKDRIFTNLYGFQEPWLKAAQQRGDWDDTKSLMAAGQDAIIVAICVGILMFAQDKFGNKRIR